MKNKKLICLALAALILSCGKKGRITINGSTALIPVMQKAAEKFSKSNTCRISIEGNGSKNGINSLFARSCDIAASSYRLSPEEFNGAVQKGIALKEVLIGYDMIVPVVNLANAVENLTKERIRDIYIGKISSWKEAGGADEKIIVVSRDFFSGAFKVWNERVLRGAALLKTDFNEDSNYGVVNIVSDNTAAIGYIASAYLNDRVKSVKIDGVAADEPNARSGKYPLTRELFVYFNDTEISERSRKFALFLTTDEGQKCVARAGYMPIK
jgi:phosphate transport system substrate-binding protein